MLQTPAITLLAASGVALVAAATDLRARRIPNWLVACGLVLGLILNVLTRSLSVGPAGALSGATEWLAGAALGLACLFPFYLIRTSGGGRAVGAGDVKLMASIGAIVGVQALLSVAFYSALAGAVQSILVLGSQGYLRLWMRQTVVMGELPRMSGLRAPYAVAIAAGVLLTTFLPAAARF